MFLVLSVVVLGYGWKRLDFDSSAWQNWNRDGNQSATAYSHGPVVRVLQGKSLIELDALLAKVNLAASTFRSLFPGDNEPEVGIRHRNAERHSEFLEIQTELLVPKFNCLSDVSVTTQHSSIAVPGRAYCTVEVVDSINEVALSSTTSQSNSSIS